MQALDPALYSAFGKSEVSVIYTQLNQYYVVLEVAPQYWQSPAGLNNVYLRPSIDHGSNARHGNDSAFRGGQNRPNDSAGDQPYGLVSVGHGVIQSGAGRLS